VQNSANLERFTSIVILKTKIILANYAPVRKIFFKYRSRTTVLSSTHGMNTFRVCPWWVDLWRRLVKIKNRRTINHVFIDEIKDKIKAISGELRLIFCDHSIRSQDQFKAGVSLFCQNSDIQY
jgi:hypothetical protein